MSRRVLGVFPDEEAQPPALSATVVEVSPLDLVMQWSRCGATADYLAGFLAYAFERREVAASVLSTVINELVENAAKFSANKRGRARFDVRHRGDVVEILTESMAEARHVESLEAVFEALASSGAEALFAERLQSERRGGLGLLMLAKDYAELGAELGAPDPAGLVPVTIRAAVRASDVEQR